MGCCFFISEIPPRSVFGARCTGFCAWNSGTLCLQQWNCLPRSQPEVFLVLGAQVSVPATVELPATMIFSFGSGVTFGPGRGTAGGCSVTPCQGVFLIRRVSSGLLSVPWNSGIACQNLDFFIRFRSDVWPGQRDGRRLLRHAVPGCFPDSKVVLWIACQHLDFFIRFRSDVWPGRGSAGGCSVTPCQGVFLIRRVSCGLVSVPWNSGIACQNLEFFIRFRSDVWPGQRDGRRLFLEQWIACQNLGFFIRFRSDVWPGQRDGRRLFRHAVPGCFPDSKVPWNSGIA